jgi:hypothetical protein
MNTVPSTLVAYSAPDEAARKHDFTVKVKTPDGDWVELFIYAVRVDMHDVREASMATLDFAGSVEVEVTAQHVIHTAAIRPLSQNIAYSIAGNKLSFRLEHPCKISIELNGERFHNLHLFANGLELGAPAANAPGTVYVEPGVYETDLVLRGLKESREAGALKETIYFGPGMHRFIDGLFYIPSGTTVYIAGGAIVVGSFVCDRVENVAIRGRGIVYLRDIEKTTYWKTVQIDNSRNVTVEDIVSIDPPHYSIQLGGSDNVSIRNFKSFSCRGWCDGIDMMSSTNIRIENVFLRTSDDCIAIYGSRGAFRGDTSNVRVRDSILWADVAHPIMIGCHGDYEGNGDTLENLSFDNLDILEHHEPQENYWGCMTINAGDQNTVRNVTFSRIRVEQFELGRLIDIRVFQNPKYNPAPGKRIENVLFDNIAFDGVCDNPSVIAGFDDKRIVDGVRIRNLRINGKVVVSAEAGHFECNEFQQNLSFRSE